MKLKEAMIKMMDGNKVTRKPWIGSIYFIMNKETHKVESYKPHLVVFQFNEEIMISDGWKIDNSEDTYYFYDIIPFLQQGYKAWMKDWNEDSYIYYDESNKYLVILKMEYFSYMPDFESFTADDWVVLDKNFMTSVV